MFRFLNNRFKNHKIQFHLNQKAYFSKDIFKRPVSESDVNHEKFRRKFLDVEKEKWVVDNNNKESGRELFYPKYGNSFWDPTINDVNSKKK